MKENEPGVLVTPFTHGFNSREEAMENIGLIQSYLDQANIGNSEYNRVADPLFVYMCKKGKPHAMGSWKRSERTRYKIEEYRTNYYWFNFNDLSCIPPESRAEVISSILNGPFRFIQESFSSGDRLVDKRYHLYLPVTELEEVDFEVQQLIYEWVRDDLGIRLGIQLDDNTYLHKNILASRNNVKLNKDAPIFDLQPYLNKYKRIEKVAKKKNGKMDKQEVIQQVKEEDFKGKGIESIVNFNELMKAFKTENLSNLISHKERGYLFMVLNNMEEDGQISDQQKRELAEVLNNG